MVSILFEININYMMCAFVHSECMNAGQSAAQAGSMFADGTRAFVAHTDGLMRVWDLKAGAALHSWRCDQLRRTQLTDGSASASASPSASGADATIDTGTCQTEKFPFEPSALALHRDDIVVAVGHLDGFCTLLNSQNGKVRCTAWLHNLFHTFKKPVLHVFKSDFQNRDTYY